MRHPAGHVRASDAHYAEKARAHRAGFIIKALTLVGVGLAALYLLTL